jgi:hypothetical protein
MTENAPDLSPEAAEVVTEWDDTEEAGLERWLQDNVTGERRTIWRVYNDAIFLSNHMRKLSESDSITKEEKVLVEKLASDLFWQAIKLSALFPGAITASVQIND